jgi:hypothetical protein
MKLFFFSFAITLFSIICSAENITSNEYYVDGKLRRKITYDQNLSILSEIYYRHSNLKQIARIDYRTKDSLNRITFYDDDGTTILYDINFELGKYIDTKNETVLSFRNNFIFEGKQLGNHIIANYRLNKRDGPVLQFDSTIAGQVKTNKVFVEYDYRKIGGLVYITNKTYQPIMMDTFRLYKGALCNFKNDLLDGKANVFSASGRHKIKSEFTFGKCISYTSYDALDGMITALNGRNGTLNGKAIINGKVKEFNSDHLIWCYSLDRIGEIYALSKTKEYDYDIYDHKSIDLIIAESFGIKGASDFEVWNKKVESNLIKSTEGWNFYPKWEAKKKFDESLFFVENISDLRKLFGIPYFYIKRFDFNNYDKNDIAYIPISSSTKIDSNGINTHNYRLNFLNDTLIYKRSPFFLNPDSQSYYSSFYNSEYWREFTREDENRINGRFNYWLQNAFNHNNTGVYDMVRYRKYESNNTMAELLRSYSDSLLKFCFALYLGDSLPSLRNISKLKNDFLCSRNIEMFILDDTKNRFTFSIIEKEHFNYISLYDKNKKLYFTFEDGPFYETDYNEWRFTITDHTMQNYYFVYNKDGSIIKNNLDQNIQESLKTIYYNFHQ